jgi:hypothetical protein
MRFTLTTGHCLIKPDHTSFNKTSSGALPQCTAMLDNLLLMLLQSVKRIGTVFKELFG